MGQVKNLAGQVNFPAHLPEGRWAKKLVISPGNVHCCSTSPFSTRLSHIVEYLMILCFAFFWLNLVCVKSLVCSTDYHSTDWEKDITMWSFCCLYHINVSIVDIFMRKKQGGIHEFYSIILFACLVWYVGGSFQCFVCLWCRWRSRIQWSWSMSLCLAFVFFTDWPNLNSQSARRTRLVVGTHAVWQVCQLSWIFTTCMCNILAC